MKRKEELRQNRISKMEALHLAGPLAYPAKTKRTHNIAKALADFDELSREEKEIVLVGRIRSLREHGQIIFLDIQDGSSGIQIMLARDTLGEKLYELFLKVFDIGDFIEARGVLFTTKREEPTLKAADFKMLSKSILPLPEKWHGLQDIQERFRKRYLDLLFNAETRQKFEHRSKIIKEIRHFLEEKGFIEVETPVLQPIYGGTAAAPFTTYHNTHKMQLYLRIAPELYLKRLLIGGFERVYEFARCFRNEGIDRSHNPEFTALEFYVAYADYKDLMKMTEEMLVDVLKNVFGKTEIWTQGEKIDFTPPWPRVEFEQLIREETGVNLQEINEEALKEKAKGMGIEIERGTDKAHISDAIFKHKISEKLTQPTFVIHHPQGLQPLAKPLSDGSGKLASFQLYIAGWEIVNAFSELNDPLEQRRRFNEQEKLYKKGFDEAQRMDEDFLEALEHGMPPAAGFGMGIDRLCAVLTNSLNLREIILFPTMKPRE